MQRSFGCLEYHRPIIAKACPPKRSHKSLRRNLVPLSHLTDTLRASLHIRSSQSPSTYLSQPQRSTLPATIAIPLLPFPFQPFASRWFLVLLFFFFLLVPKSLLCCSRCFGPVLVYVQSSSIYTASLLFS